MYPNNVPYEYNLRAPHTCFTFGPIFPIVDPDLRHGKKCIEYLLYINLLTSDKDLNLNIFINYYGYHKIVFFFLWEIFLLIFIN